MSAFRIQRFIAAATLLFSSASPNAPARPVPETDEIIGHWLILGPIRPAETGRQKADLADARMFFLQDLLADCGGDGSLIPRDGQKCELGGMTHQWRQAPADGDSVWIGDQANSNVQVSYLASEIDSQLAGTRALLITGSTGLKVWINGQVAHEKWSYDAGQAAEELAPVMLKRGRNSILVKTAIIGGPLPFSCRLLGRHSMEARLLSAAAGGRRLELQRLLSMGVNPDSRSDYGLTAYQLARLHRQDEAAKVLEDSGAKPDAALPEALELGRKIEAQVTGKDAIPAYGSAAGAEESTLIGHKGPWGEIEYVPIVVGPSLEYIPAMMADRRVNRWFFSDSNPDSLRKFFDSVGLTESQRSRLMAAAQPMPEIRGLVITPEPDIVSGLNPEARRRIYARLLMFSANQDQANAFHFPAELADEWLAASTLSEPVRTTIRRLMFPSGRFLMFADLSQVLPLARSRDERDRMFQVLAKQRTYLMKLRIREGTDVEALAGYWGRGGRRKDVKPLLESLASTAAGQTIDVVHLLPAFARRRIYTFPLPSTRAGGEGYDCHYTSLNFFNDPPDERVLDTSTLVRIIGERYHPVYANFRLGDLVLFLAPNNEIIHSAVYVADDMLFTKYGNSPAQPWMLMTLDEVHDFYPMDGDIKARYFRLNHLD